MGFKMNHGFLVGFFVFCVAIMSTIVGLNFKAGYDSRDILIDSIESQLLAISMSAREIVDADEFKEYNSASNLDDETILAKYNFTLNKLKVLARESGAEHIYALKRDSDNNFFFVFDAEHGNDARFTHYSLNAVHQSAFAGKNSAGVKNVDNERGKFNTGAVPIFDDRSGDVIGIISVDMTDQAFSESINQFRTNMIVLIVAMSSVLGLFGTGLFLLIRHSTETQENLNKLANYDKLTDLPNRRYLMDYLTKLTTGKDKSPFALYFIDLDNFKKVNDNAGHDAGDAVLQRIGAYFQTAFGASRVFRPGAGNINVTARVGGDEFILTAPGICTEEQATKFAQEILSGFNESEIDKYVKKYGVGLSIGVSLYPYHTENPHVLIKYADTAMYNSKRQGKNRLTVYNESFAAAQTTEGSFPNETDA